MFRAPADEQVGLLSRECAYSSMVGCDQIVARKMRLDVDGLLEIAKLRGGEDD